jgi:hypothetical protein
VQYTRIFTGADGVSHFEDLDLAFAPTDYAPPAPLLDVSGAVPAETVRLVRFPAGWSDPAHPSPARQWMCIAAGAFVVTTADGTRTFVPGDVLLVEDTGGPGHGTTVDGESIVLAVRLPD